MKDKDVLSADRGSESAVAVVINNEVARYDKTSLTSRAFERVMCGEVIGYVGFLAIRNYYGGDQVALIAPTMGELSRAWDNTAAGKPLDVERVQRVWICAAENATPSQMTTASAPTTANVKTETE